MKELRDQVAQGVAWSLAEKIGSMLLQMAVSIVVLRLLMPDDFGVIALLTAFSAFAQVVVDSGFSQTLIRKSAPEAGEYKAVFLFNVAMSWLLYLLFVAAAPAVARYYGQPVLAALAPVFFLLIPANALCVIQLTIFTRQFRFALLSKVTFFSTLFGGLIAIGMALAGCGVWSLVAQRVTQMVLRAAALWCLSDWRPTAPRDPRALRTMAPYSLSLLATDLVTALYNKVPQLFIGRLYSTDLLGYFDQALKLKDLPVNSAMQAVQPVTFPALSKIAGQPAKFTESYRQVTGIVAFVMFPVMTGMIAVADEMFAVLLGQQWLPTIPYFRAASLAGLFYPIAMIAYNVLKVKSDGKLLIRIEILKKAVMTLLLALTIPRSVGAVVWGIVAASAFELTVNFAASMRYTALTPRGLLRTLLPPALASAALYAAVALTDRLVHCPAGALLMLKVAVGAVVYLGISAVCRFEAFRTLTEIVRKQLVNRR